MKRNHPLLINCVVFSIQALTVQQVRLKLSYFDALYQNDFERQQGMLLINGRELSTGGVGRAGDLSVY